MDLNRCALLRVFCQPLRAHNLSRCARETSVVDYIPYTFIDFVVVGDRGQLHVAVAPALFCEERVLSAGSAEVDGPI